MGSEKHCNGFRRIGRKRRHGRFPWGTAAGFHRNGMTRGRRAQVKCWNGAYFRHGIRAIEDAAFPVMPWLETAEYRRALKRNGSPTNDGGMEVVRSEELPGGKGWVSRCRSGWARTRSNKNKTA